jgi:hypothetical protein
MKEHSSKFIQKKEKIKFKIIRTLIQKKIDLKMKIKPSKRTKRNENKENDESITRVYSQVYFIEKILDKRINKKGNNEYLIKWQDYSEKDK